MGINYAHQKFLTALLTLTASGTIQDRLAGALCYSLGSIGLQDVPEGIRDEFRDFMESMTAVHGNGDEGDYRATVESFDEMKLTTTVEKILSFYDTVTMHYGAGFGAD